MALVSLGAASLRIAGTLAPGPLERVVAAAPLGVAFAVLSALLLGFVGQGAEPFLLTGLALAAWLAARLAVPSPGVIPLRTHVVMALGATGPAWHIAIAVLLALAAIALVWALAQPVTGIDAAHYNLPESLAWIQSGTPGSVEFVEPIVPVGYQPLIHEVLFGWLLAIARSFTPLPFPAVALFTLAGAAAWLGLRRMDVPRLAAGLAVAVLLTMPVLLGVVTWPKNDIAVLAWLASAGALFVCAREHPRLVAPALVALGLALGTKSTALVPVFFLCLAGVWAVRSQLGGVRVAALAGLLGGLAVAAPWYIRDLIDNGSPLWPYLTLPGGRPTVPFVAGATSFIDHPLETLRVSVPVNVIYVGPAPVIIIAGAVVCALVARTRAVILATGVAGIGLLAWAMAPFTGVAPGAPLNEVWSGAANVRYAIPAVCVALLAIALAARREGAARTVAGGALGVALAANVVTLVVFAFQSQLVLLAPLAWVAAAVILGVLLGVAAARVPATRLLSVPVLVSAVLLAVAALSLAAPGYPERHETIGLIAPPQLMGHLAADPAWRNDDGVVAMGPRLFAPAAGARLQHPLRLATPGNVCSIVRNEPRGWLALTRFSQAPDQFANARRGCLARLQPVLDEPGLTVYELGD